MRILHTADWHLGHILHSISREREHAAFLDWLLDTIPAEKPDVFLHAGDVFDSANPPASAQSAWYRFVAEARRRAPRMEFLVIGGNHDSPDRLDAPSPILDAMNVRVVGGLAASSTRAVDERAIVPLRDASGEIKAWAAAVPFLRPVDFPPADSGDADPLIEGVRRVYADYLGAARERCAGRAALIATGHLYMAGGALSELSERKILGGNQHALPADIFPDDVAYVALGHLHRPQTVGGRPNIRYSGSPIALSTPEAGHAHGVCVIDVAGTRAEEIRELAVPRTRELLTLPPRAGPLADVLELLKSLPDSASGPEELWPLLEVRVALASAEPGLKRRIDEALIGRAACLVRLAVEHSGSGAALTEAVPRQSLQEMNPEDVFVQCYKRRFNSDPPPPWLDAFRNLVEAAQHAEGAVAG